VSGGISAISGFDYQATVILDLLSNFFDEFSEDGNVRPEGIDDLDLCLKNHTTRHIQIKKPTEDKFGNPNPSTWTLNDAAEPLFQLAVKNLAGNQNEQWFVLGDNVCEEINALFSGQVLEKAEYWKLLHLLARKTPEVLKVLKKTNSHQIGRWQIPSSILSPEKDSLEVLKNSFSQFLTDKSETINAIRLYQKSIDSIHALLPNILERTKVYCTFGTELDIKQRVVQRIVDEYGLTEEVVEKTVFRNMRGYINDVSKVYDLSLTKNDFEFELRNIWPHMNAIKLPPETGDDYINRYNFLKDALTTAQFNTIEIIGTSGAGKTLFANEIIQNIGRDTFYAEVRSGDTLLNVLQGLAFHLTRYGYTEPFGVATNASLSDEMIYQKFVHSFTSSISKCNLIIDFVEGICDETFGRELCVFSKGLKGTAFKLVTFSQNKAFNYYSAIERETFVQSVDFPGLHFEEFLELCSKQYDKPDRGLAYEIFTNLTAGRGAGLLAGFALSMVNAYTLQELKEKSENSDQNLWPEAEIRRFEQMSVPAQSAAKKLICYALPFTYDDASEIFPEEVVGRAIHELLGQGLLRKCDDQTYEMHEMVRKGMLSLLSRSDRRGTHEALANWYEPRKENPAAIYHLEMSENIERANCLAKTTFLAGGDCRALSDYVSKHHLISVEEILQILASEDLFPDHHLLPELLYEVASEKTADDIIAVIKRQCDRFQTDFQWSWLITGCLLKCAPERLEELIKLSIETAPNSLPKDCAINWLSTGARRVQVRFTKSSLELFSQQPNEIKEKLLSLLLQDVRRETLKVAFEYYEQKPDEFGHFSSFRFSLKLITLEQTVEFLAALPRKDVAELLTLQSMFLGSLEPFIWSQKGTLIPFCHEIVKLEDIEDEIILAALRVLIFLGDPEILNINFDIEKISQRVKTYISFMPVLASGYTDIKELEEKCLACEPSGGEAVMLLTAIARLGGDLDRLYDEISSRQTSKTEIKKWDFCFLLAFQLKPFEGGVRLFEEALENKNNPFIACISQLSQLTSPKVTQFLLRLVAHVNPQIRYTAALTLQSKRSRKALETLKQQLKKEEIPDLAHLLSVAVIASGPNSVSEIQNKFSNTPEGKLYFCILVGRLRDVSSSKKVIEIACDASEHWSLRRAAILAAGRLPFEVALEKIALAVFQESSPLTQDTSHNLLIHGNVAAFLRDEPSATRSEFIRGKVEFVQFLGGLFEGWWKQSLWLSPMTGEEVAEWLFDRLDQHGLGSTLGAIDTVVRELHIPILHAAVLRSFFLCGRADLIEAEIPKAKNLWLVMKALKERAKFDDCGDVGGDVRKLVKRTQWSDELVLERVLDGYWPSKTLPKKKTAPIEIKQEFSFETITYEQTLSLLEKHKEDSEGDEHYVFEDMNEEKAMQLAILLHPQNDTQQSIKSLQPKLSLRTSGYSINAVQPDYVDNGKGLRQKLRPALLAANNIPFSNFSWFNEALSSYQSKELIIELLNQFVFKQDAEKLYSELKQNDDFASVFFSSFLHNQPVLALMDNRLLPILNRYRNVGGSNIFENLCFLSRYVERQEITPVLEHLLERFSKLFVNKTWEEVIKAENDVAHWRGFTNLIQHPRFNDVSNWEDVLRQVTLSPIRWFHKQDIYRVLERSPKAYVAIEQTLFKEAPFEIYAVDEVDRLDDAADRLFHQLLEE